ncbi:MAG: hypothetical protein ACI89F_001033, partial [Porticoccaceae bacterium]
GPTLSKSKITPCIIYNYSIVKKFMAAKNQALSLRILPNYLFGGANTSLEVV